VRVSSLDPNGAAAHAGLAINDVIVSVDDFNVEASAPEEVINVILRGHHVWSVTRLATPDSLAAEADHCAWCGHWSSGRSHLWYVTCAVVCCVSQGAQVRLVRRSRSSCC